MHELTLLYKYSLNKKLAYSKVLPVINVTTGNPQVFFCFLDVPGLIITKQKEFSICIHSMS